MTDFLPGLTKADLVLAIPIKTKTSFMVGAPFATIPFAFNPQHISMSASALRPPKGITGRDYSDYLGSLPRSLSIEMMLDAAEYLDPGQLEAYVQLLFSGLEPYAQINDSTASAQPFAIFQWGPRPYIGTLMKVSVKYTLFSPSGIALRAECGLTIEERRLGYSKTNPTSGAIQASKKRAVSSSQTLAHIAAAELGDPNEWRIIAAYNKIDDPMRIPDGTEVLIPDRAAREALRS